MSADRFRDRLVFRSISTLLAVSVATVGTELLIPSLRPLALPGVPFLALLGVAYLLVRAGYPRGGAWLLLGTGGVALCGMVAVTGGPESRMVPFLPILAMAAAAWLGRAAALGVLSVTLAALAGAWFLELPSLVANTDTQLLLGHSAAVVLGSAFLGAVIRDLRAASELAWSRAAEAEQAAVAAHAADEARDRFLATVSHELRTPLDTVLGYAELLREEEDDPVRARDLDRIRSAGRQLLGLVDDILDMSKVEADALRVVREPVDLPAVVEQVVLSTAAQVAAQQNELQLRVPELPTLHSDPARIRQILINLVSNAAKYTTDGRIVLTATVAGDELRLAVADEGIGIAADQLPRLFEPFVQLHEGPDRRPGVGLGLALSQGLAARLGGRIEATSEAGVGSTFTLCLPLGRV